MASSLSQLLFLIFFTSQIFSSFSQPTILPNTALIFPVTKDASTLQYTTQIQMGSPGVLSKLVLDLNGPFLWADCSSSSSHKPIRSGSLKCLLANSCTLNPQNTLTKLTKPGHLAEQIMTVDYVNSHNSNPISTAQNVLFSCAPTVLLQGLASGANGMLGLGRSKISLPSQLSHTFGTRRKFSICLSDSDGVMLSGDVTSDIHKSLMFTPLVSRSTSDDYYINVKSVKVNNKRLALGTKSIDTKISTVVPYTTLDTTTYGIFVKAFVAAATHTNMTRVVAPATTTFGVCFSSQKLYSVHNTPASVEAPKIELVLQSEMVKWRIDGRNSMVRISDEVVCLGILDGGLSDKREIVIGDLICMLIM
ncbi:Basic 7S globulin [Heracleum sosnowskyi]|uniref:Basic 7S globulin n=1 Tax=Heracleum sosnowskyi TaxID=360622 RepID=A0AAD8N3G2_9APIA|nr:Basic 7S globulin [Heracleum sosnowskyi]